MRLESNSQNYVCDFHIAPCEISKTRYREVPGDVEIRFISCICVLVNICASFLRFFLMRSRLKLLGANVVAYIEAYPQLTFTQD